MSEFPEFPKTIILHGIGLLSLPFQLNSTCIAGFQIQGPYVNPFIKGIALIKLW